MEMEPSKGQEVEKVEEIDQKLDPSVTMKPEESEEKPNATRVSALDTILESLSQISVFTKELARCQEDESVAQLRGFLLNNLTLTQPLEANGVSELFVAIMELLPRWTSRSGEEPLNSHFQVYQMATKICNRCKMDSEYPVEPSYGLIVTANSLREIKSAFQDFTFENILKVIKINLTMPCDKEGCGKRSYVNRMINKLPTVFTIALEWENNETEEEILDTTSVLATKIDMSAIYQCEGDCKFTKYHLVSMVCLCGDGYSCVAYENTRWIRHFGSEKEVIGGDRNNVFSILVKRNIRPVILFFENVMKGNQIVFGSLGQ